MEGQGFPTEFRMLADGTYDAFVLDADVVGDDTRLELTVTAGPCRGQVVAVRAAGLRGDPIDLVGLPATIVVVDGRPSVRVEG